MLSNEPLYHTDQEDFAAHEETFALFTTMMKWGTVGVVILLVLMAYFLL